MQNKKLTITESVFWNTWGSVIYLGVQWLQTILIVRLMGYEDAGVFSLAMSVTNIFYAISVYGMKNFQISDIEGRYTAGNYVLSRVVTGVGSFLLCSVFAVINGYDLRQVLCIIAYMLFKLSETFFDVFLGFYQKHWRMDYMGKSMTMRALIILILFPITLLLTKDLLVAIVLMCISVFVVIIFYDLRNAHNLEAIYLMEKKNCIWPLLWECFPLAVYSMVSTSIGSIPRYFLEIYEGSEKLGIYASVAAPTLIVQMASTYIFNPMVTVFSESYNEKNKSKFMKTLWQCCMAIAGVSVIAIIGAKILGRFGLNLLYGESILKYEYLLIPLIICTITTAASWLFCGVLTVLRNFRSLIVGNTIAAIVSVICSILLIPIWDMQGASYALLFGNLIGIIIFVVYMIRDINKKFSSDNR